MIQYVCVTCMLHLEYVVFFAMPRELGPDIARSLRAKIMI